MTREEERSQAARIRADQYSHPGEWNDCYRYFSQGAEWADRTLIEKACRWLNTNFPEIENIGSYYKKSFIEQFKKAMEE